MNKFDVFSNKFAQDIYLQKYSLNAQEKWEDTAKRVVTNVCGQLLSKEDQEEIYKIIRDREFIPGGRYLYSSGRPFHQVNNCHSGDTKIITSLGIFELAELVNEDIKVLNRFGKWENATVKQFEDQRLFKIQFEDGRSCLATENHRWWQEDGSRITTLHLKEVPYSFNNESISLDEEGIRHGIIYGDGSLDTKSKTYSYVVLVPEKKKELAKFFKSEIKEVTVGFGAKLKINTIREVKAGTKVSLQPAHYKTLPSGYMSPEYARGFIAGLIATDGSTKTSDVTISCEGLDTANKIAEIAVMGGCTVSNVRVIDRVNPFNGEPRELAQVTIWRDTAPLIRQDQISDIQKNPVQRRNKTTLKVESIVPISTEKTYCVVAPESESFVLANGLITSNCFLYRAEDSREGWADLMQKVTSALMTGGGIGVDYSTLREEGSFVKRTGGTSTGPLALMKMIDAAGRGIMQGGQRRSAIFAGLNWKHKDVFKFLEMKNYSKEIKDMKLKDLNFPVAMELTNISVIYDTEFFIAIENSTHPLHDWAKLVWAKNCLQAFSTAEPGFSFNFRKDNESLRNACVTGETEILTKNGYEKIEELVDKPTLIWNGFEWSEVVPKITGYDQNILSVSFSDGRILNCTPYHKFYISTDYSGGTKVVEAKDLEPGMKLIKHEFPVINGEEDLKNAYTQGFVSAEGMELNKTVYVYKPKEICLERIKNKKSIKWEENNRRYRVTLNDTPLSKNFVPLHHNLPSKLNWLAGLFDGDGTELKEGGLQLVSINREFLVNVQKLLSTLGVQSKILLGSPEGDRLLPDHRGSYKYFKCKQAYRICVGSVQIQNLKKLGLKCERLTFNKNPQRDASQFITIVDVTENEKADVVYCFNEPKRHLGIFNGVITGQCTEVTSEDDSDKCNLGTIWINRIKDKKRLRHVTKYATKFLLCGGIYSDVPTEKVRLVGNKNNRIGLGLGGIHEWLMVRHEGYHVTPELHKWLSIYEQESDSEAFISAKALSVSVPKGVRAIAPNGTIGIIAETTTGIEPLFCKAYKRRYFKDGKWLYQNVVDGAVKRLLDKGVKLEEIQDAYDLGFKDRVKFQADVQNYVDMAISSTCNLPEWGSEKNNEITLKDYSDILLKYAKRLRGFTCYPDGSRGGQPLTRIDLKEALESEGQIFEETETSCTNGVCGL